MRGPHRPTPLFGGLSSARFLKQYWQKTALLVRAAIAGFSGLLSPRELIELACNDQVQARVVVQRRARWDVYHGPFHTRFFRQLPTRGWTLLVQDVNHVLPAGRALLDRFNFIPYARLDDLMVSYAPPGGGVGPHFDSYDVFLLQGLGKRRWQISRQTDLDLIPGTPLKLLADFRVEAQWVLHPGDMLYLPPNCAHNGVAIDECMTYSIGFRAPAWQELGEAFLAYLQDNLAVEGVYADPGLAPVSNPARISREMIAHAARELSRVRWRQADVTRFLGCYLTEPKAHVLFFPPRRALSLHAFSRQVHRRGVRLDLKSQMLYAGTQLFINGECERLTGAAAGPLRELADRRALRASAADPAELREKLYRWYRAGYLQLNDVEDPAEGAR